MFRLPLVLRLAAAAGACAPLAPAVAFPQELADVRRAIHETTIERARDGAARKIEQPGCRRLLDEFKDKNGRPLSENLATWDRVAADYLRTIPFRDGSFHPFCRSGKPALVSVVGCVGVRVPASASRPSAKWQPRTGSSTRRFIRSA